MSVPLAAGTHVDHQLVFLAGQHLAMSSGDVEVLAYEDCPYVIHTPTALEARLAELGHSLGPPRHVPIADPSTDACGSDRGIRHPGAGRAGSWAVGAAHARAEGDLAQEVAWLLRTNVRTVERQMARAIYKLSKQMDGHPLSWWERWF